MEQRKTPFEYTDDELKTWVDDVYNRHGDVSDTAERIRQTSANMATVISSLVQLEYYNAEEAIALVQRIQALSLVTITPEELLLDI